MDSPDGIKEGTQAPPRDPLVQNNGMDTNATGLWLTKSGKQGNVSRCGVFSTGTRKCFYSVGVSVCKCFGGRELNKSSPAVFILLVCFIFRAG